MFQHRQTGSVHLFHSAYVHVFITSLGVLLSAFQTGATHLVGFAFVQLDSFVPLVHVVWVLPQQHAVEQQRTAGNEQLEAGQPQLQIYVFYTGRRRDLVDLMEVISSSE